MHATLEDIQQKATPLIRGPLKVYFVLGALLITMLSSRLGGHLLATAVFLGLAVDAVGIDHLKWATIPVAFFVPGIGIILLITPGTPVVEVAFLSVTGAGIETAIRTLSRSIAALSILTFFVLTTPVHGVISTLRRMHLPAILVELFLYLYRAIQLTFEEALTMREAASARMGFRSRRTSYRSVKLIASALLIRSFDRIERFGDALRARNYDGTVPIAATFESAGYPWAGAILLLLVGGNWL